MKKQLAIMAFLAALITTMPGCEIIGGIFKAGVGVGIFIVIVVVALVIWLISKVKR